MANRGRISLDTRANVFGQITKQNRQKKRRAAEQDRLSKAQMSPSKQSLSMLSLSVAILSLAVVTPLLHPSVVKKPSASLPKEYGPGTASSCLFPGTSPGPYDLHEPRLSSTLQASLVLMATRLWSFRDAVPLAFSSPFRLSIARKPVTSYLIRGPLGSPPRLGPLGSPTGLLRPELPPPPPLPLPDERSGPPE
jgi:hypothetical protein